MHQSSMGVPKPSYPRANLGRGRAGAVTCCRPGRRSYVRAVPSGIDCPRRVDLAGALSRSHGARSPRSVARPSVPARLFRPGTRRTASRRCRQVRSRRTGRNTGHGCMTHALLCGVLFRRAGSLSRECRRKEWHATPTAWPTCVPAPAARWSTAMSTAAGTARPASSPTSHQTGWCSGGTWARRPAAGNASARGAAVVGSTVGRRWPVGMAPWLVGRWRSA